MLQDRSQNLIDLRVFLLQWFHNETVPTCKLGPWSVFDEMKERKYVSNIVLNRCPCQTPSVSPGELVNSFRSLNDSALDVVCLIKDYTMPFVLVNATFLVCVPLRELMGYCSVC